MNIKDNNGRVLRLLSDYISYTPDAIDEEMIRETMEYCKVSVEEAFRILILGIMDVFDDRELKQGWFSHMFSCLDSRKYENDPYKKTIKLPTVKSGQWEFTTESYKPYEAFVYDDLKLDFAGRVIPQIGFFEKEYSYPVVKQGGREWMLITPNEIETMKKPIDRAFGKVLTYGLGLGYFAFMASLKENVESVTVVEKDPEVIDLFSRFILPQFQNGDKVNIINASAYEYCKSAKGYDFVFADIWHDPSDGCEAYLRLREYERADCSYSYWIEDTIEYYLSLRKDI
ncbi:MAG: hypothetical protein IJA52_08615 [Clostridia bacterium]|nr:hypothetical protein [Clostridia bacterium]